VLNGDNSITIVRPDDSIRATISVGDHNIGIEYHGSNEEIYVSDTLNDVINVIGFLSTSSSVTVDGEYDTKNINFQFDPIILKHTRFTLSGIKRIDILKVIHRTPTGKIKTKTYSFNNYDSPQNFLNVSEVMDLEGHVIDGKTGWEFFIPGLTTTNLLLYYRQFNRVNIINPLKKLIKWDN